MLHALVQGASGRVAASRALFLLFPEGWPGPGMDVQVRRSDLLKVHERNDDRGAGKGKAAASCSACQRAHGGPHRSPAWWDRHVTQRSAKQAEEMEAALVLLLPCGSHCSEHVVTLQCLLGGPGPTIQR